MSRTNRLQTDMIYTLLCRTSQNPKTFMIEFIETYFGQWLLAFFAPYNIDFPSNNSFLGCITEICMAQKNDFLADYG